MQGNKIKVGQEYAVSGYGGLYRARCEDIPRKGIYERSQFYLFRKLELRTGEATSDTFKAVARDVHGLWEDHKREVLEHKKQEEEKERGRAAVEAEIRAILAEIGFTAEDFAIRGQAIRIDARVVPEHSGVDIGLPVLRAWHARRYPQDDSDR